MRRYLSLHLQAPSGHQPLPFWSCPDPPGLSRYSYIPRSALRLRPTEQRSLYPDPPGYLSPSGLPQPGPGPRLPSLPGPPSAHPVRSYGPCLPDLPLSSPRLRQPHPHLQSSQPSLRPLFSLFQRPLPAALLLRCPDLRPLPVPFSEHLLYLTRPCLPRLSFP